MCKLLGVSKQAYYQYEDTSMKKQAQEAFVVEFIKKTRKKASGIGGEKLWFMYQKKFGSDSPVGFNRFYDIIEKYNLKVRKRKRRTSTTNSNHNLPLYPNLTSDLIPARPNELWVSDITYLPILQYNNTDESKFCYLSIITDYYTKEIIGYSVGDTLETRYPMEALDMALKSVKNKEINNLIHHSDRGVQYASYAYTNKLKSAGINISMTENGNPKDNAVAERINNTIKNELLYGMTFISIGQVKKALKIAVNFYNNERPHMSLDGLTPKEASLKEGEIKKRWTSYRENAIKNKLETELCNIFV